MYDVNTTLTVTFMNIAELRGIQKVVIVCRNYNILLDDIPKGWKGTVANDKPNYFQYSIVVLKNVRTSKKVSFFNN